MLLAIWVPVLVIVALALDLRHAALRRLGQAEDDFARVFGRATLARVRGTLSHAPELARRLTEAAAPNELSVEEYRQLVSLARVAEASAELPRWLPRCETLLGSMDRARQSEIPAPALSGSPAWGDSWRVNPSMRAINSVRACGLAAVALGEREMAITAVELLGAFARSLAAWPLRLSLMVAVSAERNQLELVERLQPGAGAQERPRLVAALLQEDPGARHLDAIAGEALYASEAWRAILQRAESPWVVWYLGPFGAGAQVRDLTRFVRDGRQLPGWVDAQFLGHFGQWDQLERERNRLNEVSARRDEQRRLLQP